MSKKTENIKRKKNKRKSIKRKGIKRKGMKYGGSQSNPSPSSQSNPLPSEHMTRSDKEKAFSIISKNPKKDLNNLYSEQVNDVKQFYKELSYDIHRRIPPKEALKSTKVALNFTEDEHPIKRSGLILLFLLGGTFGVHFALSSL